MQRLSPADSAHLAGLSSKPREQEPPEEPAAPPPAVGEGSLASRRRRLQMAAMKAGMAAEAAARAAAGKQEQQSGSGVEMRIDPHDGQAYDKHDFISEYGGTDEWDKAPPA